ncbi:hypothetical protein, partial [Streptomyces sp. NPDC056713]|uniref:hypothetical protein n=1 Tax=Streptomyces sp. NPDC056713 TaxID=3345921 RepID=UPI00367D10C1
AWGVDAHLLTAALDAMRNSDLTPSGIRADPAGIAWGVDAHLLTAALDAMRNSDLTPSGIRADPAGAAALLRTASWFGDTAAATTAEQAASPSRSDPDWTAFITALEAVVAPT